MKSYTFHWEIRDILAQVEDALSNVVIKRYNKDREPKDQINVSFRYAPKTRTLHEIEQKNQHFKMPVMAMSLGGLRRNKNRVFTKIDGSYWTDTSNPTTSAWVHLLQPVPVDLTVNLSIVARFQQDIDQIISNFVPYCDQYIVVSWKWPQIIPFADFEIRSHVLWNEDVSYQYPLDITSSDHYKVIADTSFTVESWMFKNQPPDGKPIYIVDTSFTAVSDIDSFEVMRDLETTDNTDSFTDYTVISARPQFTISSPTILYQDVVVPVTLYGRMLDYTEKLYVSASDFTIFDVTSSLPLSSGVTYVNSFTGTRFISAFPGFSGIEVSEQAWNIIDEHQLILSSIPVSAGNFDVIAWNRAGYGKLTTDSIRPTLNPYPSSAPEYLTYTEYQPPVISGIEVRIR